MLVRHLLIALASLAYHGLALEWNTFDGEGNVACYNVTEVKDAHSVSEVQELVKDAASRNLLVRAAAKGHMWYDTQCADQDTMIIKMEGVNDIWDFDHEAGSVMIEGGVTFFQ